MAYSFLLLGAGSIGRRHAANLVQLGHTIRGVYNPSIEKAQAISNTCGAEVFASIKSAFSRTGDYDAVLICSPNNLHLEHVKLCLQHNIDFFLEKPAFMSSAGTGTVVASIAKKKLKTLVGCNMRFTSGFMQFEQIVLSGKLGRLIQVQAHNSSYLPEWRPGTDYLKNYAAKRSTGGGILLDGIHEIDYVRSLAGSAIGVSCLCGTYGQLGIETEDTANMAAMHKGGVISSLHLDYLDRIPTRWVKAVGSDAAAQWDFVKGELTSRAGSETAVPIDLAEDRNLMYVREMEHFSRVLAGKEKPKCSLADGMASVRIVEAAKLSSKKKGVMVAIKN